METQEAWLVLAFEPDLVLAMTEVEPGGELVLGSTRYRNIGSGAVTAFYDRILNDAGRLAAIRVWPMGEGPEALLARLPRRPYLRIPEGENYFDVYLHGPPYPNASSEGDQSFGGRFYEALTGAVAISLDLTYLAASPEELEVVRSAPGRWVAIRH